MTSSLAERKRQSATEVRLVGVAQPATLRPPPSQTTSSPFRKPTATRPSGAAASAETDESNSAQSSGASPQPRKEKTAFAEENSNRPSLTTQIASGAFTRNPAASSRRLFGPKTPSKVIDGDSCLFDLKNIDYLSPQ